MTPSMKNSCPASPPRLPWLPPRSSEKFSVVVLPTTLLLFTANTQLNQRPARHECTAARETSPL